VGASQPYAGSGQAFPGGAAGSYPHQAQPGGRSGSAPLKARIVKNHVNLQKRTLALQNHGDGSLSLKFAFDCNKACTVSVFWLATEDLGAQNKHSISTAYQPPGPRVHFLKKLGGEFSSAISRKHDLKLDLYKGGELEDSNTSVKTLHTWPLIIRLEALDDEDRAGDDNRTENSKGERLDDFPVGGALPQYVQSQTNYCVLAKDGDSYTPKLMKQIIWKEGMSYELQEIYGLESGTPVGEPAAGGAAAGGMDELAMGRECVICLSEPRDTTVLPCRHMCMCNKCANELRNQPQTNKCPICRTPVDQLLEIKIKSSSKT